MSGEQRHRRRWCPAEIEDVKRFCVVIMEISAEKAYAEFVEKVKRTVYLDNLGLQVTAQVLKTALGQFGNVVNVSFIAKYMESLYIPQCALVEMEAPKQARAIVRDLSGFPFMISGMPRPVRAKMAKEEMFSDRPAKPGRNIHCHWVEPGDPDYEVAQKIKDLVRKHAAEHQALLQLQFEEEENLAKQQEDTLRTNLKKYELMESVTMDRSLHKLTNRYGIKYRDD